MFKIFKNRKAQSTAEYAILIGLVVAVAVAMQTYVKRGLQARFKDEVDDMAAQTSELGTTGQYEPDYLTSNFTTEITRDVTTLKGSAQAPQKTTALEQTQNGIQNILASPNR
jgi:gas vesicle protein